MVLALEQEMDFLWCVTPVKSWREAFEDRKERLLELMSSLPVKDAARYAREEIAALLEAIVARQPALAFHVFSVTGGRIENWLVDPPREASDCVARNGHAEDGVYWPSDLKLADRLQGELPHWIRSKQLYCWDVLAAPLVAARVAADHTLGDKHSPARCAGHGCSIRSISIACCRTPCCPSPRSEPPMLEIEDLAVDLPRRAANAVLTIAGCKSRTLRRALINRLGAPAGSPGSLAEPILEGAYPWRLHPGGWSALSDNLRPDTVQTLQARMGYPPYAHPSRSLGSVVRTRAVFGHHLKRHRFWQN